MVYIPDNPIIWGLIFFMGAAIGSFLNVVIYRWPQHESVVTPPSRCGSCGVRLDALDMIPVLSYIFLRGRCRHCGRGYSMRYAIVEALVGGLLVAILGTQALSWTSLALFIVCCCLVVVFFIDLDHMIIPDEMNIVIGLIGVGLNIAALSGKGVTGPGPAGATYALQFVEDIGGVGRGLWIPASFVGMALGGGVFLLVSSVFERFYGKPVMGMGDIKLAVAMGAMLGPGISFIAWFLLSVIIGAVIGVFLMATGIRKRGDYIPFGPMLAVGAMLVVVIPELVPRLVSLYGLH